MLELLYADSNKLIFQVFYIKDFYFYGIIVAGTILYCIIVIPADDT